VIHLELRCLQLAASRGFRVGLVWIGIARYSPHSILSLHPVPPSCPSIWVSNPMDPHWWNYFFPLHCIARCSNIKMYLFGTWIESMWHSTIPLLLSWFEDIETFPLLSWTLSGSIPPAHEMTFASRGYINDLANHQVMRPNCLQILEKKSYGQVISL